MEWYESERAGLGLEFKAAVDALLAIIARQPTLFRCVRGPARRAVLKRFPYTVHFVEETNRLVVLEPEGQRFVKAREEPVSTFPSLP